MRDRPHPSFPLGHYVSRITYYVITCRPSGALRIFGLAINMSPLWGYGCSPSFISALRVFRFILIRVITYPYYAITCRPSGALRCVVSPGYKHVAPLGLNTGSSPSFISSLPHLITYHVLHIALSHVAPLGLNAPVLLSSNGLGNPTPTSSDHYIKKPLINQPHRANITGIRKGVLTFCLSPIRQVL